MPARSRLTRRGMTIACALAACGALAGCADTLQNEPLHDRDLEGAAQSTNFPIYWLGRAFDGYSVSSVLRDNNGAFSVGYGDCLIGGQAVCVTPLLIVTSPDNSFVPGTGRRQHTVIRGRRASVSADGLDIALPTGSVVVSVFARRAALARAGAQSLIPINETGAPAAPLPRPTGDNGYARTPLGGRTQAFVAPPAAGVSGDALIPVPPH